MKKYLKIIMVIGASTFVGFVAYATVQTNKISDDINTAPEIAIMDETIIPYEEITIPPTKIANKNTPPVSQNKNYIIQEPIINQAIEETIVAEPTIIKYEKEEYNDEKYSKDYYDRDDEYENEEEDD